ncbi:hypothetical protein SEA_GARDENSTATE_9 [Microbacterium phage GardenState]|uniref:Head-to-tail stopper n=2 Tax=Gardenstatevirus TaxID=3425012 RepID=A0A4Y6EHW0_9CAUD|nr:hypothetical protein SEA_IAMGROOT_9 [Microbacterium phage IAmGroot]QOI66921.1 hypothetical protein SEA_GARDENSTATE_9 [Microbacterium phage GardenState]
MLTSTTTRERIELVPGVPQLDSYGEPTTSHIFDPSRASRITRAKLARPSSSLREVEGFTLADNEAVLIVLRRFRPEGPYRIRADGVIWEPVSDPIVRQSLASGILTAVKLQTTPARPA